MADGSVKIDVIVDDGDAEKKLKGIEDAAEDAGDGLDDMGDSAGQSGQGLDGLNVALGNVVADGISNLIGSLGDAVQSLFALAEETREFREDMAKLDSAFTTTGHSSETANDAYTSFYKILGESDRSVEAVNHLAELTKNEEEVAKWSTIAAGVTAKFGDSLPIEGLTEAANETAKVGQVIGPLADALNWAGISEDEFNKKLAACNSEQERATLITETLNSEYAAAAGEYNELTASTQAAREATANMEQAQADLGAAVEPLTTAWTNLKTQAFEAIQPVVEAVATKFTELIGWLKENPAVLAAVSGALIALGVALGVVTAAVIAQTVAQWAQNAAWLANPITWIVLAIVAAVGALVGAFLYLWKNSEAFRDFFLNMWEGIKTALAAVGEFFANVFSAAWDGIKNAWSACVDFFSGLWDGIKNAFSAVGEWFSNIFQSAWNGIESAWSAVGSFFSGIWEGIKSVFSAVGSWFGTIFSNAWNAIKNAFSAVGQFFGTVWNNIKTAFTSKMSDMLNIGKNIIEGIKKGISNAWSNLKEWFSGLFGDLIGIAKKILGIKSPSRVMRDEVGEMLVLGLAKGIADNGHEAIDALADLSEKSIREAKKGAEAQVKVLEDEIKALEEKRTDANKNQIDAQKKTLQKELDIAKEKEKAITSYASTYEKQLNELVKLEESYVSDVGKIQEQLAKDIEAAKKKYDDAWTSRVESIKSGLSLFDEAQKGDAVKGADLIKNLESQTDILEDYNAALDELSGKGINSAFVDELKGMGVDALPQLEAINKMTEEELAKYVELWEEKNKLAEEAATEELKSMRDATDAEIVRLREDATNEFFLLHEAYKEQFVELAEDIAIGMEDAGNTGLEVLGDQLGEYISMMDGLINGIDSKEGILAQQMEHVIRNAIYAAKKAAGIHSPSKVMADEVGANLGLGTIEGWKNKVSAIKKTMSADMSQLTANIRATVMAENARFATNAGAADTGFSDLARAVGIQTAGINSLAGEYRRGSGTMRPIIIELNGRELGHAFVDTGGTETVRIGSKISLGGAKG